MKKIKYILSSVLLSFMMISSPLLVRAATIVSVNGDSSNGQGRKKVSSSTYKYADFDKVTITMTVSGSSLGHSDTAVYGEAGIVSASTASGESDAKPTYIISTGEKKFTEGGTYTYTIDLTSYHTGAYSTATFKVAAWGYTKKNDYGDQNSITVAVTGEAHTHKYDQKVTSSTYLKSDATHKSPAVYYYSCSCGAKGSSTFTSGSAIPHTYNQKNTSSTYLKSAATHASPAVYYYSCSCGAKGTETFTSGSAVAHSYT